MCQPKAAITIFYPSMVLDCWSNKTRVIDNVNWSPKPQNSFLCIHFYFS